MSNCAGGVQSMTLILGRGEPVRTVRVDCHECGATGLGPVVEHQADRLRAAS
jgi:hypothetical protein